MNIKIFITIGFLTWSLISQAQTPDSNFFADRNIEELGLFAGYNFNAGSDRQNLDILELGIKRTYQISALRFYGVDDYILVEGFGNIPPTREISVAMWLKLYDSKPQFQLMLCPDDNRFAISAFYFHDGRNTTFWNYGWGGEGGDAPGSLYFRPEPFDTLWHHYVFNSSISNRLMKI